MDMMGRDLQMSQATKMGVTKRGGTQSSFMVRDSLGTTWKTILPYSNIRIEIKLEFERLGFQHTKTT